MGEKKRLYFTIKNGERDGMKNDKEHSRFKEQGSFEYKDTEDVVENLC